MQPKTPKVTAASYGYKIQGVAQQYWSPTWKRYITRSWPQGQGADSPHRASMRAQFSQAVKVIKYASPQDYDAAKALSMATPYLYKDLLMKAAMGTLIQAVDTTGRVWIGMRDAIQYIQPGLNSIGATQGGIVFRDATYWGFLGPGGAGQVLTSGGPNANPYWADAGGGGGGGTAIDLFNPPAAADFPTIINGGGASPAPALTDWAGAGLGFDAGPTITSTSVRAALKNVIGSTWQITARLRYTMATGNYRAAGLAITDGTKFIGFGLFQTGSHMTVQIEYDSNSTTFSSTPFTASQPAIPFQYLRIGNDGTNLTFYVSEDGRNYAQVAQLSKSAFLGTITQYGFYVGANRSGGVAAGDHISLLCPYWDEQG